MVRVREKLSRLPYHATQNLDLLLHMSLREIPNLQPCLGNLNLVPPPDMSQQKLSLRVRTIKKVNLDRIQKAPIDKDQLFLNLSLGHAPRPNLYLLSLLISQDHLPDQVSNPNLVPLQDMFQDRDQDQ